MDAKEVIAQLAEGEGRLAAIAALEPAVLSRSYGPGKWNGFQILAHLADVEIVFTYRFLKDVAEEGSEIVPFDQNRWLVELRSAERPAAVSLAAILGSRALVSHLLAALPAEALARKALHPEKGVMTPLAMAAWTASHAAHHLEQLEAIRDGRRWEPKG